MTNKRIPFSASPPRILSIAGSDPSGGAGIQADLKTFASLGCYGMCALTALTAQNTQKVQDIHITPTTFFRSQLRALWEDVEIDSIKIGMLGNGEIIKALNEELNSFQQSKNIPIVLDPVMVSTSGSLLLTEESVKDLINLMLPKCSLLTPNFPEAEQLLKYAEKEVDFSKSDLITNLMQASRAITSLGSKAVLIKGGHEIHRRSEIMEFLRKSNVSPEEEIVEEERYLGAEVKRSISQKNITIVRTDLEPYADVLISAKEIEEDPKVVVDILFDSKTDQYTFFIKPFVQSTATHGTGCTLSSALAVNLCQDQSLTSAVHSSIQYVQRCISRGLTELGKGAGPLNHLCVIQPRPVLAPTTLSTGDVDRFPLTSRLISHSLPHWRAFTQHPFVAQLANHSLDKESFTYFLRQDYLFLKHYARIWASGASSFTIGNSFERIATFAGIAAEMANEAKNHIMICSRWGVSREDLERTVESSATLAYTRFVLDVSRSGDALEFLAATGPCLLGYGEVGKWMAKQQKSEQKVDNNSNSAAFQEWIDYYAGSEYQRIVFDGIQNMERYAAHDPPSLIRTANLQRIWDAAIKLEIGMWDEALNRDLRREVFSS